MLKYYVTLLLGILILSGCGVKNIQIVDQAGRVMPTPHYILMSTSDLQIRTASYWATFKSKKDLDGSTIQQPNFIPYTEDYKFSMKKYSHVSLTIEVLNPKRVKYQLVEHVTVIRKYECSARYNRKIVGISDLPYRQFTINLPFHEKDIGKIKYGVDLITIDDMPIMRFGNLNYKLLK